VSAKEPRFDRHTEPVAEAPRDVHPEAVMSKFGKKFTCWSCATKLYDMNKPNAKCPKCGADPADDPKKDLPTAAPANYGDDFTDEVEAEAPEENADEEELEDDLADDGGAEDEY
jgi:hypothetical protein